MIRKVIGILFICIFTLSPMLEAHELLTDHEMTSVEKIEKQTKATKIEISHCDDCTDSSCSDSEDCCSNDCRCTAPLLIPYPKSKISIKVPLSKEELWYFTLIYHSPSLDPSLKPPLFS